MKLPFSFGFGKKEKPQYFLSLLLRDEKANAVIFEESAGKAHIVGEHEEYFTDAIENASIDEWLEVLDKAISAAESSLPPNIETQKTIFGVKENWVEDGKIKREYLIRLKKVSDALGLSPIGFLIIHEAIVHLLSEKEGVPVSAILVELGKNSIAVSLLRAGRVLDTRRTKLEDSIAQTTDRILHHFTEHEILPSRIIVFNGSNHDELSQEFIGHTWSKSLPFLHVPQITALPNGFDARALLFGAATQMGFELLGAGPSGEQTVIKQEHISEEISEEALPKKAETVPDRETSMEEFGFVRDTDVVASKEVVQEEKEEEKIAEETFVSEPEVSSQPQSRFTLQGFLHHLRLLVHNILLRVQRRGFSFPQFGTTGRGKIVGIPLILLFICIGFVLLYIFFLTSTVAITIEPKVIEQDQAVTLAPGQPTDFDKRIVQVAGVSVSEDGSVTTQATGKKEVGDRAKGTVTVYNSNVLEGKTLTKGTKITSSNSLVFILDNSATLASASGDASSITPSTAKVSVSADEIGKESNLPSGAKFTIAGISSSTMIAKNDTAFSGGSKKEIIVVAKADIDKLLSDLPRNLEEKAKKDISQKVSDHTNLIPGLIKTTITKKEFSHDAGEEASSVGLKGTVTYDAFAYDKDGLTAFSKNIISQGGSNLIPSENGLMYEVKDAKEKKDITATLHIKATLVPKIDDKKLKEAIAGKTFDEAKSMVAKIPQVKSVDVVLSPNLFFLPKLLPKKATNITLVIHANG